MPAPSSPTTSSADPKVPVLNSWKEIATYLGRGVRTVQRYERELHLPVRRFNGKPHASVFAVPRDLDAWLRQVAVGNPVISPKSSAGNTVKAVRASIADGKHLRRQCRDLRMANWRERSILLANLTSMIMNLRHGLTKKITH